MEKKKNHFQGIKYTWEHKKAFLKVEKELLGKNSFRGYMHDADKLLWWYFIAWITNKDAKWVQTKHRSNSKHHVANNLQKSRKDYIEMIIDWECARYTKPDKPLNAYETMKKFYPKLEDEIIPLLKELKLIT